MSEKERLLLSELARVALRQALIEAMAKVDLSDPVRKIVTKALQLDAQVG